MAYITSSSSNDSISDHSSPLSFLPTSEEEIEVEEIVWEPIEGSSSSDSQKKEEDEEERLRRTRKQRLTALQQSRLLIKKDPISLNNRIGNEKASLEFRRERKSGNHQELAPDINRGAPMKGVGFNEVNDLARRKWKRTAQELEIRVPNSDDSDYAVDEPANENKMDSRYFNVAPPKEPTSHCIYAANTLPPHLKLIEVFEPEKIRRRFIPVVRSQIHGLDGGIVHVFDTRSLRAYRFFDHQEFFLLSSLRFDEMDRDEQLSCISFCPTRHSIALGFADGTAAICRIEIDHSVQTGRGRHKLEWLMSPTDEKSVIINLQQHPCTTRFVAMACYDASRTSYIIRVIDRRFVVDERGEVKRIKKQEKPKIHNDEEDGPQIFRLPFFLNRFPSDEDFDECRSSQCADDIDEDPFDVYNMGYGNVAPTDPVKHARVLSMRIVERVTDLMWFNDRRNLLMIFTEKSMRLCDIKQEGKDKLLKSCTLARPVISPRVHPGRPTLFSALDELTVVIFDRRCLKSPVMRIDLPSETVGRGIPNQAEWCPSQMNKLIVHFRDSIRGSVIQFNGFPDCDRLTDGGCNINAVSPLLSRFPKDKELGASEFRWPRDAKEDCPLTHNDHFICESDLNGELMDVAAFPDEWRKIENKRIWLPEFDSILHRQHPSLRRFQSDPDISTKDDERQFIHPQKRYMRIARDRHDTSFLSDCVEWQVWEQIEKKNRRRSKSLDMKEDRRRRRLSKQTEEEHLIKPIPSIQCSTYEGRLEKKEVLYPVFLSEYVDHKEMERTQKVVVPSTEEEDRAFEETLEKTPHLKSKHVDYEDVEVMPPRGPPIKRIMTDKRRDIQMNTTRVPVSKGSLYYGIQGRPLHYLRSNLDHANYIDRSGSELTRRKKRRIIKESQYDDILIRMLDEEDDLMRATGSSWLKNRKKRRDKYEKLRTKKIRDLEESDASLTIDSRDPILSRSKRTHPIKRHDFNRVENRSLFDSTDDRRRLKKIEDVHFYHFELPVEDPQSLCLLSNSPIILVQGAPGDIDFAPNVLYCKVPSAPSLPKTNRRDRFGCPQLPDMPAYLRSIFGVEMMHNVKSVKSSGFGEFKGVDIPKGYMDTFHHLRKHIEDSDGNRFAFEYLERMFKDNHIIDYNRGFPMRFEVDNPDFSDTSDEDDPKKRKLKRKFFNAYDDRPKLEQLNEKLRKKRRDKFLTKRRACEALKLDYDKLFPMREVRGQPSLTQLYRHGDPKRSILMEKTPKKLFEVYSGSSDSNQEAHYPPKIINRLPHKPNYDFEEEEQMIEKESLEIEIIKNFRLRGVIPPLEFEYDEDGNMLVPKPATLDDEFHLNIQTTRTLLRRICERDMRIFEYNRRKNHMLDRLPDEKAEDTYDRIMTDMRDMLNAAEPGDEILKPADIQFKKLFKQRKGRFSVYGNGWKKNRKKQSEYLKKSLDLCDKIAEIRQKFRDAKRKDKDRRRAIRMAKKKAKKLLREIARRDIAGEYYKSIQSIQFRRHAVTKDFDFRDFLYVFEECTLKMCGRKFVSHAEIVRKMSHIRKNRLDKMDSNYCYETRAIYTDASENEEGYKKPIVSPLCTGNESTTNQSSNVSLDGVKRKRRRKKSRRHRRRFSERTYNRFDASELTRMLRGEKPRGKSEVWTYMDYYSDVDRKDDIELMSNHHPDVLKPLVPTLFYERNENHLPIGKLIPNLPDPLNQLMEYSKKDLKPPPHLKIGRAKRMKNRKQRKKRNVKEQESKEKARGIVLKHRIRRYYLEMIDWLGHFHLSTPSEQKKNWKIKREKAARDKRMQSYGTTQLTPHRSLTRKFLDTLGLSSDGKKSIKVYANGSIWPPSKKPFTSIFDKFPDNPFARCPAPSIDLPPVRHVFFVEPQDLEISMGLEAAAYHHCLYPPDPFTFPLDPSEELPNQVKLSFPIYWKYWRRRTIKQRKKRFNRYVEQLRYGLPTELEEDQDSEPLGSLLDRLRRLEADRREEIYKSFSHEHKLQRALSDLNILRVSKPSAEKRDRAESCIPAITLDKEPIEIAESKLGMTSISSSVEEKPTEIQEEKETATIEDPPLISDEKPPTETTEVPIPNELMKSNEGDEIEEDISHPSGSYKTPSDESNPAVEEDAWDDDFVDPILVRMMLEVREERAFRAQNSLVDPPCRTIRKLKKFKKIFKKKDETRLAPIHEDEVLCIESVHTIVRSEPYAFGYLRPLVTDWVRRQARALTKTPRPLTPFFNIDYPEATYRHTEEKWMPAHPDESDNKSVHSDRVRFDHNPQFISPPNIENQDDEDSKSSKSSGSSKKSEPIVERQDSIDMNAIDPAAYLEPCKVLPPQSQPPSVETSTTIDVPSILPSTTQIEVSDQVNDEDEMAADMEVMQVFGQNLVPPIRPDPIYPPLPPQPEPIEEEKPPEEIPEKEEIEIEVPLADDAFEILVPVPKIDILVVPDEIIRPKRLLDLIPPNLMYEGIDFWGLTDEEKETRLDEFITEREKIREQMLRPPPKIQVRKTYQLVHTYYEDGKPIEKVEYEFYSTDSDGERKPCPPTSKPLKSILKKKSKKREMKEKKEKNDWKMSEQIMEEEDRLSQGTEEAIEAEPRIETEEDIELNKRRISIDPAEENQGFDTEQLLDLAAFEEQMRVKEEEKKKKIVVESTDETPLTDGSEKNGNEGECMDEGNDEKGEDEKKEEAETTIPSTRLDQAGIEIEMEAMWNSANAMLEGTNTTETEEIVLPSFELSQEDMEVMTPSVPVVKPPDYLPVRTRKSLERITRRRRQPKINQFIEDKAWATILEHLQCQFHHNGHKIKPMVYIPDLNLIRGVPRHLLVSYINHMRIRRWEEHTLLETLEEQNHLFRLKKEYEKKGVPPPSPREAKVRFRDPDPEAVDMIREPLEKPNQPRGILKKRRPVVTLNPEATQRRITNRFIYKKKPKIIEEPRPDDTRFPTEIGYDRKKAETIRFEASKHLLRPGTEEYRTKFIYKCKGIPGIIQIAMEEQVARREYIKDTKLLGAFFFMRSKQRIAVLRSIGLCDYKTDQIGQILDGLRIPDENPFALALMALMMGQGTYFLYFIARIQRDGWYDQLADDLRVRAEAKFIAKYVSLYCDWRAEYGRVPTEERNFMRRGLLLKYMQYKQLEDGCIFTRCIIAFLMCLAYSETRQFVDEIVLCKQVPMMFRVAFCTLFYEKTDEWQQGLFDLLAELPPHDVQRFAFTGVGRHPDSMNAILEFVKHTSDVQFGSFLLIIGKCFDVQPFVRSSEVYEKQANRLLIPRRELFKIWFSKSIDMEKGTRMRQKAGYRSLVKVQSALLGISLKNELLHAMAAKTRRSMEQCFPVAVLYPQVDMERLTMEALDVMRHYAFLLQATNNWIAAGQIFYVLNKGEPLGMNDRFDDGAELACSFCQTTLSFGRRIARKTRLDLKKKTEEARERHMEAQKKRMEQGLPPQPFTGGPKKGPVRDIPDDVDTSLRPIACLACQKPLPRCAICFNHMFNPVANEEGLRGERIGFGFVACRRCHHGGHPDHLSIWFKQNFRCPVAQCLCECDYDNYWDSLKLHEALDMKLLGAPQVGMCTGMPIMEGTDKSKEKKKVDTKKKRRKRKKYILKRREPIVVVEEKKEEKIVDEELEKRKEEERRLKEARKAKAKEYFDYEYGDGFLNHADYKYYN